MGSLRADVAQELQIDALDSGDPDRQSADVDAYRRDEDLTLLPSLDFDAYREPVY